MNWSWKDSSNFLLVWINIPFYNLNNGSLERVNKLKNFLIKCGNVVGSNFWIKYKVQIRKLISYCYFVEGRSIDEVPTLTFHPVNLSATHQPGTLTSLNTWIPLAPYFISRRLSTNQQASEFHEISSSSELDNCINSSSSQNVYCKIYWWRGETIIWSGIDNFFFLFLLKIKIIKKLNESVWYKNDREILLFYIIQIRFS